MLRKRLARYVNILTDNIIYIIGTLLSVWIAISCYDVIAHQFTGGTDAAWNFWVVAIRLGEMMGTA